MPGMLLHDRSASNRNKSIVLVSLFIVFVMVLGWVIGFLFGGPNFASIGLLFAFIVVVIWSLIAYYASDGIALSVSRAKPAPREQYLKLHNIVEGIAIAAGLPKPRVYVINDPSPNAFATGRDPKHAAIAVTTGLLAKLDKWELEGVIAHEMSHVKNRDILVMTIAAVLVGVSMLISDIVLRSLLFGGFRGGDSREGGYVFIILIVVGVILAILAPVIATLIRMAISRRREFLADVDGALLTRYPEGLARALEKIAHDPHELKGATNATAHMYISTPFRKKRFLSGLFATHPPVTQRIAALRNMDVKQVEAELARRQERMAQKK